MRQRILQSFTFFLFFLFQATACTGELPRRPSRGQIRAGLEAFSGSQACADLEKYIEDTAVLEMKADAERDRLSREEKHSSVAPSAMPDAEGSVAPNHYTTTNTQIASVDEADLVKTDGTRMFVLSRNSLYSTLSWPASSLSLQGKVKIEGEPLEMFLADKKRVVVFSRTIGDGVKVTVIDATSLAAPVVEREVYLPGNYISSRRIQDSVRVVLSGELRYPKYWREFFPAGNEDTVNEDRARLNAQSELERNERMIRRQHLEQMLPVPKEKRADGTWKYGTLDCKSFYRNTGSTRLGILTVATLNLSNPSSLKQINLVAQAGEVYASAKNLYVTNHRWGALSQKNTTYIHKFDISQPLNATYVASGEIEGQIVNQFSIDEAASGHLRVATMTTTHDGWGRSDHVRVLAEKNGALQVVGSSEPLAADEGIFSALIFSARFVGNKGYVLTQGYPLFTFDLSNPTRPAKVGELNVGAFFTNIHPLDANHLLTIGTYPRSYGHEYGWLFKSRKYMSIFDVTDMANPKQTFEKLLGGKVADPWHDKALYYFAARKLLAVNISSGLRVYEVDPQTGFQHKGDLSMLGMGAVRRSVMVDDFVYAISDAGIRVANVGSLSTPVATVVFEKPTP